MEARKPNESIDSYMARRQAATKMIRTEQGTASARELEQKVEIAIQNANADWVWGQGDADGSDSDDETPTAAMLPLLGGPKAAVGLLEDKSVPAPAPAQPAAADHSTALVLADGGACCPALSPPSRLVHTGSRRAPRAACHAPRATR